MRVRSSLDVDASEEEEDNNNNNAASEMGKEDDCSAKTAAVSLSS